MKTRFSHTYILRCVIVLMVVCLFVNCSPQNDLEGRMMPVHITIPVDGEMTRTIGDPGVAPQLSLPTHAYMFLVVETDVQTLCTANAFTLVRDKWQYDADKSNPDAGIIIYTYTDNLSMFIQKGIKAARIYVALSNAPIYNTLPRPTTETEIQNLTFNIPDTYFETQDGVLTANDDLNDFLKNLYTTPYNLNYSGLTGDYEGFNGKYYGTFLDVNSNVPRIDIICYHTAAKLDVIWNVADDALATKKVTSVAAKDLYYKNCSLFKPTENPNINTTDTYTQSFGTISAGNEWYGRASMYVIQKPSAQYSFVVGVNDIEKTETVGVTYVGDIYTPWMRGFITVKP